MSPAPLRPGEGTFPDDQIFAPQPPSRFESSETGVLRNPPTIPAAESHRQNVVRIWHAGLEQPAIDLAPEPDAETHSPADLFGEGVSEVFIVSGVKSFDRITTRDEDAETLLRFRWRLDHEGWDWRPTVATSPDRQWVEGGALVLDGEPDQVTYLALRHGQSVVLRWNDDGMAPVPTRPGVGVDVEDAPAIPVRLTPVRTGCPLRRGADGVCKMYGGPWTSSSRAAALVWQNHRSMLLDAFGCDVCRAEGGKGAIGAVDLFSPSREGGWQWAWPKTLQAMRDDR